MIEPGLHARLEEALSQNRALAERVQQLEQQQAAYSGREGLASEYAAAPGVSGGEGEPHRSLSTQARCQAFLDKVSVQAPQPPLKLSVVTVERLKDVCERENLSCNLFRLMEAPAGLSVAQIMRETDLEGLTEPSSLPMRLRYASTEFMRKTDCKDYNSLRQFALKIITTNAAFRHEWHGQMRNLKAGRLHGTVARGVLYNNDITTAPQVVCTMVCAELDVATGKTYVAMMRLVEVMSFSNPYVQYTAMQDMMALKYSPSIVLIVCPKSGCIVWQNSASCSAMGIVAADVAIPFKGSCEPVAMNYLQQVFWGDEHLQQQMEETTSSGRVFRRRCQIKGPQLRELLGVVSPRREVWHHVQCSSLKDPMTHRQMYIMSQRDITDVVLAERRVKQLQKQQLNLLKEMLPQQVIDVLLSQDDGDPGRRRLRASIADRAASAVASAASVAMGDEAWGALASAIAPFDRGSFVSSTHSNPLRSDTGNGASGAASVTKPELGVTEAPHTFRGAPSGAAPTTRAPSNLSQMQLGASVRVDAASELMTEEPPGVSGAPATPATPTRAAGSRPAEAKLAQGSAAHRMLQEQPSGVEALSPSSQASAFLNKAAAAAAAALDGPEESLPAAAPGTPGAADCMGGAVEERGAVDDGGAARPAGREGQTGEGGVTLPQGPTWEIGVVRGGGGWEGGASADAEAQAEAAGAEVDVMEGFASEPVLGSRSATSAARALLRADSSRAASGPAAGLTSGRPRPCALSRALAASMRLPAGETPLTREYCREWCTATSGGAKKRQLLHAASHMHIARFAGGPARQTSPLECEALAEEPKGQGEGHRQLRGSYPDRLDAQRVSHASMRPGMGVDEEEDDRDQSGRQEEDNEALAPVPEASEESSQTAAESGPNRLDSRLASFTGSDSSGLHLSRRDVMALATWHEEVTILFTDLKGFTSMSSSLHPSQVMLFLNHLYSLFDDLVTQFDVYKVETIGDSYMVAAGLFDRSGLLAAEESETFGAHAPTSGELPQYGARGGPADVLVGADLTERTSAGSAPGASHAGHARNILGGHDPDHAAKLLAFAKAMSETAASVIDPLGNRVQMRVGIHTGSVMSGVVGRKCPRFCLFGDTVNTASRMESTGEPGRIHVSQEFHDLLPDEPWEACEVFAKGKGNLTTYFLDWEVPILD